MIFLVQFSVHLKNSSVLGVGLGLREGFGIGGGSGETNLTGVVLRLNERS